MPRIQNSQMNENYYTDALMLLAQIISRGKFRDLTVS